LKKEMEFPSFVNFIIIKMYHDPLYNFIPRLHEKIQKYADSNWMLKEDGKGTILIEKGYFPQKLVETRSLETPRLFCFAEAIWGMSALQQETIQEVGKVLQNQNLLGNERKSATFVPKKWIGGPV
jgi:hypothetical protein